jgi:hypothetical protein
MTLYFRHGDSYEHRALYERHHGPIPKGFHVHHKNENIFDNDPDNLEALSPGDHNKLHSKKYVRRADGGWDKICRTCGVQKPLSEFYALINEKGYRSHRTSCKPCQHKIISAYQKMRRRIPA